MPGVSLVPPMTPLPDWQIVLERPPLVLLPILLDPAVATRVLTVLDHALDWEQPRLTLYGRTHPIPRRQYWMGDAEAHYRYSGQEFQPRPWHPLVLALRDRSVAALAERGIAARFNSVLLNRYGDGGERMGWHSDDEPELGSDPLIVAVSLGMERPLRFRWKDRRAPSFNVHLPHGSLLLMGTGAQQHLQHALPPRATAGLRISLTFRYVHHRGSSAPQTKRS